VAQATPSFYITLPKWEVRHLDGRRIASTSMTYLGVEEWVRVMISEEHDCRPDDVTFATDDDGEGWILVEKVTGWDTVAQDHATKLVRVGYYQQTGDAIRDCPPHVFACPLGEFLEAAE
jgi:hypothetical protein